jgi:hypothetical protein
MTTQLSLQQLSDELSRIEAPSLEEWCLVGCGVNDDELVAISQKIISKYKNTLLHIDLSSNKIRIITPETIQQYFPPKLRIHILDGNPIVCNNNTKIETSSNNTTAIKTIIQNCPYLGYLGDDITNYTQKCFTKHERDEICNLMKDNRLRCRLLSFRSRLFVRSTRDQDDRACLTIPQNQGRLFVLGLWPIILQNSLRAFMVSTWDHHRDDDKKKHDNDDDNNNNNNENQKDMKHYSKIFSIFNENTGELEQCDAIFLMLRERAAVEIFR